MAKIAPTSKHCAPSITTISEIPSQVRKPWQSFLNSKKRKNSSLSKLWCKLKYNCLLNGHWCFKRGSPRRSTRRKSRHLQGPKGLDVLSTIQVPPVFFSNTFLRAITKQHRAKLSDYPWTFICAEETENRWMITQYSVWWPALHSLRGGWPPWEETRNDSNRPTTSEEGARLF